MSATIIDLKQERKKRQLKGFFDSRKKSTTTIKQLGALMDEIAGKKGKKS